MFFVRRVCPVVGVETDPDETDGGGMTILSESIVDFQIQYFDGSEWLDEWINDTELPRLVVIHLAAADVSDLSADAEENVNRRILQRTVWMHFPGQPKLDQTISTETQTSETQTQSTESRDR